MAAWITISVNDLYPLMVSEQLDALRSEELAPGQADPFTEIAPAVIAKVRSYIGSNRENLVDSDPAKIPAELKLDVCYLVIAPMMIRLGLPLTSDQQKQVDLAHTTLIALRDKQLLVSKPDSPVTPNVQQGGSVQVVHSAPRSATSDTLRNL